MTEEPKKRGRPRKVAARDDPDLMDQIKKGKTGKPRDFEEVAKELDL